MKLSELFPLSLSTTSHFDKALAPLANIAFDADANLSIGPGKKIDGHAELLVSEADWNGYKYSDLSAIADFSDGRVEARVESGSPMLDFTVSGGGDLGGQNPLQSFLQKSIT